MRALLLATCVAMTCTPLSTKAAEDKNPNILDIFDRFTVSNVAASKCIKPDPEILAKFLANYEAIIIYAKLRLKEMYPKAPEERIERVMLDRIADLGEGATKAIDAEGCETTRVAQWLTLFDMHAKMDLWKVEKPK